MKKFFKKAIDFDSWWYVWNKEGKYKDDPLFLNWGTGWIAVPPIKIGNKEKELEFNSHQLYFNGISYLILFWVFPLNFQ